MATKKPSSIFGAMYQELYKKYSHIISDSSLKKEIASRLYILDSTTVSLFKAILKPAGRKREDGKSKGGMKSEDNSRQKVKEKLKK